MRGFPALVDAGAAVDVRVFATEAEQDAAMGPGIRRLLRLAVPSPVKAVERQLNPRTRLVLGANPDGSLPALLDDCADAAVDALVPAPVWTRAEFAALRDRVADALAPTTLDVVGRVEKVLAAAHEVQLALPAEPPPAQAEAIADIRAQLDRLLPAASSPPPAPRIWPTSPATSPPSAGASTGCPTASTPTASGWRACTPCRTPTTNSSPPCRRARAAADDVRDIARTDRGAAGEPVGPAARHRRGRSASSASTGRSTPSGSEVCFDDAVTAGYSSSLCASSAEVTNSTGRTAKS